MWKFLKRMPCFVALAICMIMTGCSHNRCINPANVVTIDHEGEPLKCENAEFTKFRGDGDFDDYLNKIGTSIRDAKTKKILIFVHGGLNSLEAGLKREPLVDAIMDSGADSFYPVLIDWDSGLKSSYLEHLFTIRQGKKEPLTGIVTSPFILVEDTGRIITRAPISWYNQLATDWKSLTFPTQPYITDCNNATYDHWLHNEIQCENALYCALRRDYEACCQSINVSLDDASAAEWQTARTFGRTASYWVTMPLKYTLVPIIDGFGKPAWENMVRRTRNMYRTPSEFDLRTELAKVNDIPEKVESLAAEQIHEGKTGTLAKFFSKLEEQITDGSNYEITVIGHSMGTIVLNEFFRSYRDYPHISKSIENIVYMAAACSIRDMQDSVIPFMQSENHNAKFYNLTLHPLNDSGEANWSYLDVVPRGSLLEWIDNFLTTPATPLDRTLGKWENIIQATHVIPEKICDRVTIKGFGVGTMKSIGPQQHGEFDEFCAKHNTSDCPDWKFWSEVFWTADDPSAVRRSP